MFYTKTDFSSTRRLSTKLTPEDLQKVITTAIAFYINLSEKNESLEATKSQFNELLDSITEEYTDEAVFKHVFLNLEPFIKSHNDEQRSRSIESYLRILPNYKLVICLNHSHYFLYSGETNLSLIIKAKSVDKSFVAETIARLVPRLNDPVERVRSMTWDCIKHLLEILPESLTENESAVALNGMTFPLTDGEEFHVSRVQVIDSINPRLS
jgi:hypothetical protein